MTNAVQVGTPHCDMGFSKTVAIAMKRIAPRHPSPTHLHIGLNIMRLLSQWVAFPEMNVMDRIELLIICVHFVQLSSGISYGSR